MDGELTCGICLELFDNPLMLPCSHNFCRKCLAGIIDSRTQFRRRQANGVNIDCPLCQRHLFLENGIDGVLVNRTLENIVEFRKSKGVLPCGDASWNTDSNITENTCKQHDLPMSFHCQLCNLSVCKECSCFREVKGAVHRCVQIKELSNDLQAKISNSLTEIKKKSILVNDRVQLLEDMLAEIDANEKKVEKLLELEISALITRLKARQEELSRTLHNDFQSLKGPVTERLQRLKNIQGATEEHLKRLSMVKATKDLSLRVKLMQDSERQLSNFLRFDLAWFSPNDTPTVDMPAWSIVKEEFEASMEKLNWKQTGTPSTKQNSVPVSKHDNVRGEDQCFTNFFGGKDRRKGTDSDITKFSAASGLATFLKTEASSTRNTSSKNLERSKPMNVPVSSSIPNVSTHDSAQQNTAVNTVPTTVSHPQSLPSSVQSSIPASMAFPTLTSADFVPTQNISTNDQSGKNQGRSAPKPSITQSKSQDGKSNIKLSMENQVSSFSESGFTGNILQNSTSHRDSGLARPRNSQQQSASLSGTLESLSLTSPLSSVSSTSTISGSSSATAVPKFLVSEGQTNTGASSNFLFSTSSPFSMPAVPAFKQSSEQGAQQNVGFKQPSFIRNSTVTTASSRDEGSIAKTSTTQADSASMSYFEPIFNPSVNMSSFSATLPENPTVTSNSESSMNQNSLIMPAFGTSVPITVSTNATASSTALSQSTGNGAAVNHGTSGVSSLRYFPKLSARDFSPSRDAGSSSQKPSIRRILKSKKTVKK